MVESILRSITDKFAFLWRVLGSPRVAGSEKAVSGVKTAWSNRERATKGASRRTTSLTARTRNLITGVGGLVAAVLLVWIVMSTFSGSAEDVTATGRAATPTPFAGPEFMTEVQGLSIALTAARDAGLVSQNFNHLARRIQFGEYAQAIGEADRAKRGLLETPSETEIWAFTFAGDVVLEIGGAERIDYDNLTVVLDALTGKVYRVEAFYGEYESEARAPVWLRPPTPTPEPRVEPSS